MNSRCVTCGAEIRVMVFRGTGACCQRCDEQQHTPIVPVDYEPGMAGAFADEDDE